LFLKSKNKREEQVVANLLTLLEESRKEQKLSHQTLADKAGLHRSTISLVMRQKVMPTILVCFKIAAALEVSLPDLIVQAQEMVKE
jgi:DNA-binding XRE family transcriptional regulator